MISSYGSKHTSNLQGEKFSPSISQELPTNVMDIWPHYMQDKWFTKQVSWKLIFDAKVIAIIPLLEQPLKVKESLSGNQPLNIISSIKKSTSFSLWQVKAKCAVTFNNFWTNSTASLGPNTCKNSKKCFDKNSGTKSRNPSN